MSQPFESQAVTIGRVMLQHKRGRPKSEADAAF